MASSPMERGNTTRPSTWRGRPTRGPRDVQGLPSTMGSRRRSGQRDTHGRGGGRIQSAGRTRPTTVLAAASHPVRIPSSTSSFPKSNPTPPPWSWSPPTTTLPPRDPPPPISISSHTAARREID
ncbi:hypothetical protein PVAP13_9NG496414 [Panicum virgatum]|uniref:Uncharacterized protein n=1 Tax=Panicum virgatum TaxID=38727 RepID=A0A8T0MRH5_PANVG|nr:hypothetical protein PVAP13_9NG496414 [Panicum virgatum]